MAAGCQNVRIKETLKIKIVQGRHLVSPAGLTSSSTQNTYCKVTLDNEEIFKTAISEKSLSPLYEEEFTCDVPKKFRFLNFSVYEKPGGHMHFQDKAMGRMTLKREELTQINGQDKWFPLTPCEPGNQVQGKIHLEIRFEEGAGTNTCASPAQKITVKVLECSDLTNKPNGACNPYASVTLTMGRNKPRTETKRTTVRKKTNNPQFDEIFVFDVENRGQNHDRHAYNVEDTSHAELCIVVYNDDRRVSREVLGTVLKASSLMTGDFLGAVKINMRDLYHLGTHSAWYFLQPKENGRASQSDLGSLRLKITHTTDHVLDSSHYQQLRNLILRSPDVQPVTSSAAFLLGEIAEEEIAAPLVRIFVAADNLIPLVQVLAEYEILLDCDPNTIFRGTSLLSNMIDELMKLTGMNYLADTIKPILEEIFTEHRPCEIDASRLGDVEMLDNHMSNLTCYVTKMLVAVVTSGLLCPTSMCEVLFALKEAAIRLRPEVKALRYQVVSGFIFLRFFAPAILGPRMFNLRSESPDPQTLRTLTLVSKAILRFGNVVSSESPRIGGCKEEYMWPLFEHFSDSHYIEQVKNFIDIISSATRAHSKSLCEEVPVVLKEGYLLKRAQGKKRFSINKFKKRYFTLTNQQLTYKREKDDATEGSNIPIEQILAAEKVDEEAFNMKYMIQIVQPDRALYVQSMNCVEENQWLDVLSKVCYTNKNRLKEFHPAAHISGQWLCCKSTDPAARGCKPVTGRLPSDVKVDIDVDLETERVYALLRQNLHKLEDLQSDLFDGDVVLSAEETMLPASVSTEPKSCFQTISDLIASVRTLDHQHQIHIQQMQTQARLGSQVANLTNGEASSSISVS